MRIPRAVSVHRHAADGVEWRETPQCPERSCRIWCFLAPNQPRRSPTMTGPLARDFDRPAASPHGALAASRTGLTTRNGGAPNTVSLLDVDPDLGEELTPEEHEALGRWQRLSAARKAIAIGGFAVGTFGLGFTLGGLVFGRWRKA